MDISPPGPAGLSLSTNFEKVSLILNKSKHLLIVKGVPINMGIQ